MYSVKTDSNTESCYNTKSYIVSEKLQLPYPEIVQRYILTHCGRVTHICISKLTIIGSDNGLLPDRYQAIISTNAGIVLIRNLGTGFI